MKALTYIEHGKFALQEKAKPQLVSARDALDAEGRREDRRRISTGRPAEPPCQIGHQVIWRG